MAKKEEKKEEEKPKFDIPADLKDKLDNLRSKLDKFKKIVLEKFDKYIIGISLLPPPKPNETEKRDIKKLGVLVLVDDSDTSKMSKLELIERLDKIIREVGKDIDENLDPQAMIMSELRQACFDAKYDVINLIASGAPIYDPKDILAALKIAEVHKTMVLKKFDRYIVSYVAVGSLFRGDATSHDIDVAVIVDDADVKKMSRAELKDKLGAIVRTYGYDAQSITGVKKLFHVQVYILTDFWDAIKDAHPVMFTFLRDGVPLYDRGVFMPWKLLLEMGRIRPSPEAIDMHMNIGMRLLERAKGKLLGIAGEDIYYSVLNPSQAALMLYGVAPPTPRETVKLMDEIFVKKEKILEKKYVQILDKIIEYFKDIEHGKVKEVEGKKIDSLMEEAKQFLNRIDKLFKEIEKNKEVDTFIDVYDGAAAALRDVLFSEGITSIKESGLAKKFKEELVDKGLMPDKFLRTFKSIVKARQEQKKGRLTKQEMEKIRREGRAFVKSLLEYLQRKRGRELERAKIQVKYGDKFGEVLLLDDVAFIIKDIDAKDKEVHKAKILENGGLDSIEMSNLEEVENHVKDFKMPKNVYIKEKIFEDLRKIYGRDVEVLVHW